MSTSIDTVIIGGGQAGLATSYHLAQRRGEHVVLEQADLPGSAWRDGRWDSFTLVTPNWSFRLPGAEYAGSDPDGFMPKDEIVAAFERYVSRFDLPVRYGTQVASVELAHDGRGYLVTTSDTSLRARNVVVATGPFQTPKVPPFSAELPGAVTQIHSSRYRNPGSIPDGAVLVVGSAQSGCQIADELYRSGRTLYLCVGSAGRVPRRYRGKDIVDWMYLRGLFDLTADSLPSPQARYAPNPHVTGRDGGRTLNLHQFARDGVVLLGHLIGADGEALRIAPDLHASLAKVDAFEAEMVRMVDSYVVETSMDAPPEVLPHLGDGYRLAEITDLNLRAAGITTIIWAMGYAADYSIVKLPIFDEVGYPEQRRGVTAHPGLYFVGLPWMHTRKSSLLMGVGEDAAYVASSIAGDG